MFILFGCTTAKKATRYMREHPTVAAEFCADEFPVKTVTDSADYLNSLKIIDSLIAVQQEDQKSRDLDREWMVQEIERLNAKPERDCDSLSEAVYRYAAAEKGRADNLDKQNKELQKAARNVKPIRDTVENTARVDALRFQLEEKERELQRLKAENHYLRDFQDSMKGKVHIPWWVIVLILLSAGGFTIWRIKKSFSPIKI